MPSPLSLSACLCRFLDWEIGILWISLFGGLLLCGPGDEIPSHPLLSVCIPVPVVNKNSSAGCDWYFILVLPVCWTRWPAKRSQRPVRNSQIDAKTFHCSPTVIFYYLLQWLPPFSPVGIQIHYGFCLLTRGLHLVVMPNSCGCTSASWICLTPF